KAEFDNLNSTDPINLSTNDKVRLEKLPAIIELFSGTTSDLKILKSDLGDIASISSQCEANIQDAFCTTKVESISYTVNNTLTSKTKDLAELNAFIEAESDRLKTVAIAASTSLKRLVSKF
ncbi:MAG: hypothetical protein NTX25_03370, partial [Proteobacteria bacterium]|nr:hypothetical protein [Pseudomonadota bacterium]